MQKHDTNIVYNLDDSTGCIDARYWPRPPPSRTTIEKEEALYWAEDITYEEPTYDEPVQFVPLT